MRNVFIVFFMFLFLNGYSQKSTDGEFMFKVQLFLEKANVLNVNGYDIKGEGLMSYFVDNITLKFDTLQSFGFTGAYVFLSLSLKSGLKLKDANLKSDSSLFLFVENDCTNYVLAVNQTNGKTYRLKGFSGNDFFSLYVDNNKQLYYSNKSGLTMKVFLRDYGVNGVDFRCLYGAVKSGEYNYVKYPCLKSCQVRNIEVH